METAIGILARTLEDERGGDCVVALSSGVPDSVTRIRCTSVDWEAHGDYEFCLVVQASACGFWSSQMLTPTG